jgi:hypothetical protein
MNLSELIETLQDLKAIYGDCEVRIAYQPSWPLESQIGNVVIAADFEQNEKLAELEDEHVVYIAEGGSSNAYLIGDAREQLDW